MTGSLGKRRGAGASSSSGAAAACVRVLIDCCHFGPPAPPPPPPLSDWLLENERVVSQWPESRRGSFHDKWAPSPSSTQRVFRARRVMKSCPARVARRNSEPIEKLSALRGAARTLDGVTLFVCGQSANRFGSSSLETICKAPRDSSRLIARQNRPQSDGLRRVFRRGGRRRRNLVVAWNLSFRARASRSLHLALISLLNQLTSRRVAD